MTALVLKKIGRPFRIEMVLRPGWWILPSVIAGMGIWIEIGRAVLG